MRARVDTPAASKSPRLWALEQRQPTFRALAGLGLLLALLSGAAAFGTAAFIALRRFAGFLLSLTGVHEVHIAGLSPAVAWLLDQLSTPTIIFLIGFGAAMIVIAIVLRQVVLAGLRD